MKPVEFKEQTNVLKAPDGDDKNVQPLPVFRDSEKFISKWELSDEEKKFVAENGFIWVMVIGREHPPILPGTGELIIQDQLVPQKQGDFRKK